MISPILFIGVGGSGRSTLHWLYDDIRRELIKNGWPWIERELSGHPMPRCWGFLAIDSDYKEVSTDPDVPDGEITRVEIVRPPVALTTIHHGVATGPFGFSRLGWFPPAHRLPNVDPQYGLAQYRALGRMTAMHAMPDIVKSIRQAASAISDTEAQSDLAAVGQLLDAPTSVAAGDRRVVVVSSLSGGTGSGAWLDVAQYLASRPVNDADAWQRQSQTAILYLPELFENLDGPRGGVAPNSMFALSELLSAYADRSPRDPIDVDMERLFSGAPHPSEPNAPRSVFFVGRKSAGMDFSHPTEAYASTARMLAALLLDSGSASAFERVTVNMANTNRVPLLEASAVPASNVGFGRLDLGFEAFGEFVGRSLFKSTSLKLLDPPDVSNALDNEQRIAGTADRVQAEFFRACGLHEEDEDAHKNDQILQAIFGSDPEGTLEAFKNRISTSIDKIAKIKNVTPNQIRTEIEDSERTATDAGRRGMLERTVEYGEQVREMVIDAVTLYSARYSVPVTIELLQRLDRQLASAAEQLAQQHAESQRNADHYLQEFLKSIGLDRARDHFRYVRRQQVLELAQAFVKYVREGLVAPMERDLSAWYTSARELLAASEPLRATVRSWNGLDIPNDIQVPPTVVLVHELHHLPERTADLLSSALGLPEEAARQAAIEEVVRGTWDGGIQAASRSTSASTKHGFVEETARFSLLGLCPDASKDADQDRVAVREKVATFVAGNAPVPPSSFRFTKLPDLNVLTSQWTRTRTNVKDAVVTGFGAWLDPRHPEHQRRRKIFQSKLDQAISRSAPTVVYDVNAYQRIHGAGSPDQAVRVSPAFPFSQRSDLGVLVADRCQRAKLSAAGVPFDASSDTSRIDFVRWYPNGLHPLTQSSVTQAIVEALANPDASFWRLRQCRPLSQTLALTPAQLIAVARSWLTLVALDLVDADRGRVWLGSTATTIPSDAQALAGTVRTPADASEWLDVALKSLPARVVRYTTDSSALDWYVDLVAFGGYGAQNAGQQEDLVAINGVGSPEVADADVDVQALRRWILDAELVTSQRSPKPERAGPRTGAPDERVHALREWLVSWHDQLDEWVSGATEDPLAYYVTHPLPPESELFPYFKAAAAQLIAFVERVGEEGPGRGVVRGVKLG